MSTELVLIRHGHAVRVNGNYVHAPLTVLGQQQATHTGEFFRAPENHLDGLYCSPLRRTRETAGIIGEKIGQQAELRPGIQEIMLLESPALIAFEILSITDFVEDYLITHAGGPIRWPIMGRVSKVLLEILEKHPNQRIAVVAHAGVISGALSWYIPKKRWRWWRTTVSNCSLTRFKVDGNKAELLAVNDIRHLSPVVITTQPAAKPAEAAQEAHPVEKALAFEKTEDKK
jgi:broad specificity phosphatase PhoE